MRIFHPLKANHPLVGDVCPLCHKPFYEGQRVTLAAARQPLPGNVENVPAVPLHATCALSGMQTPMGEIERIKDGDASPYPVVLVPTAANKWANQAKLEECGLSD